MPHQDADIAVNVHSGTIMKLIDNTARIVAARHTGKAPSPLPHTSPSRPWTKTAGHDHPPILCETEDEKRRRREAQERRARRLRCRKE